MAEYVNKQSNLLGLLVRNLNEKEILTQLQENISKHEKFKLSYYLILVKLKKLLSSKKCPLNDLNPEIEQ